jgi:hypothetical protein
MPAAKSHLELQRSDRGTNVGKRLLESPRLLSWCCRRSSCTLEMLEQPESVSLEREREALLASLCRLALLGSCFERRRNLGRAAHQLSQTRTVSTKASCLFLQITHVSRHAGKGGDFGTIRLRRGTDQQSSENRNDELQYRYLLTRRRACIGTQRPLRSRPPYRRRYQAVSSYDMPGSC